MSSLSQPNLSPTETPGWTYYGEKVAIILGGPAAVGACMGMYYGAGALLEKALTLPAVLLGVTLLMIPALYIGAALLGVAPSARSVMRASLHALHDTGIIFLGLTPALAFLVATSSNSLTVYILGQLTAATGAILALRALYLRLFANRGERPSKLMVPVYLAWSMVCLGIGWQLLHHSS